MRTRTRTPSGPGWRGQAKGSELAGAPHECDIVIVGSGAAGLTAALNLAERFRVCVLAKGGLGDGSTAWAQGGIAAVLEPGDTFDSHISRIR